MRRINKIFFGLFVIWSMVLVFAINEYLAFGTIKTKWGVMTGNSALHTLFAYCVLAVLFGICSFKRSPKKKKETR